MKVKLFEKRIIKIYLEIVGIIGTIFGLVIGFIPQAKEWWVPFTIVSILLVIIYICVYLYYKTKKNLTLNINGNKVTIMFGDIFKEEGYKIIAFNEYFDTKVDNNIICENTLNGKVIKDNLLPKDIDERITNDKALEIVSNNVDRVEGKRIKYKLGDIHKEGNFLLLSFTRFNKKNEAELMMNEYVKVLLDMWKNIESVYGMKDINIPLLGDGITRIRDSVSISKQELLETILLTLKASKVNIKSEIRIVLYKGNQNENYKEFNFARLQDIVG